MALVILITWENLVTQAKIVKMEILKIQAIKIWIIKLYQLTEKINLNKKVWTI